MARLITFVIYWTTAFVFAGWFHQKAVVPLIKESVWGASPAYAMLVESTFVLLLGFVLGWVYANIEPPQDPMDPEL